MKTTLHANFLYAQIDPELDVIMVGFADDEYDTQEYVLLQRTLNPTDEDIEAGFDKIHITYNDEGRALYGGINKLRFTRNCIEITLVKEATEILNSQPVIEITFEQDKVDINEFQNHLLQLFSNEQGVYHYDLQGFGNMNI
jgi:hypothetical protein